MFIANKLFTDREDYRKVLNDGIAKSVADPHTFVKMFYGVGGQGKTALCAEFLNNIIKAQNDARILAVHTDMEVATYRNVVDCMLNIRRELGQSMKVSFSAFDIAFIRHYALTTKMENVKAAYPWLFLGENKAVSTMVDLASSVASSLPGLGLIFNLGKDLTHDIKNEFVKLSQSILSDLDLLSASQIEAKFPEFLAYDLTRHFEKKPKSKRIVIVFDHYEKLWEDKSNKSGLGAQNVDSWIRDLVDYVPKEVFFVVFGRERLKWDKINSKYNDVNVLDQHLLASLSDIDSDYFLRMIPIENPVIRKRIVDSSAGLPFYLDLQVEHFTNLKNSGQVIKPASFGHDKTTILERFYEHISPDLKDALRIVALARLLDYDLFNLLRKSQILPLATNFEKVIDHSFFEKTDNNSYSMHLIMREWLAANLKEEDPFLYQTVNELLIAYCEEKIDGLLKNDSSGNLFAGYLYDIFYYLKQSDSQELLKWTYTAYEKYFVRVDITTWEDLFLGLRKVLFLQNPSNLKSQLVIANYALSQIYDIAFNNVKAEKYGSEMIVEMQKADENFLNDFQLSYELIEGTYSNVLINGNNYQEAFRFLRGLKNKGWAKLDLAIKFGQYFYAESMVYGFLASPQNNLLDTLLYYDSIILTKQERYEEGIRCLDKLAERAPLTAVQVMRLSICEVGLGHYEQGLVHLREALIQFEVYYGKNSFISLELQLRVFELEQILHKNVDFEQVDLLIGAVIAAGFKEGKINPRLPEIVHIVNSLNKLFGKGDNAELSKAIVELLRYRFGRYYQPIAKFLFHIAESDHVNAASLIDEAENIKFVNNYTIRTEAFEVVDISVPEANLFLNSVSERISLPENQTLYTVKCFKLPFYANFKLWQIQFADHSISVLYDGQRCFILDSTNRSLYAVSEMDFIFSPEALENYPKFFFDAVLGARGKLFIVETVNDFKNGFANDLADDHCQKLIDFVAKPVVIKAESASIRFHCKSILYKSELFTSEVIIMPNGQVTMENEELILEDIPVQFEYATGDYKSIPKTIASVTNLINKLNDKDESKPLLLNCMTTMTQIFKEIKDDVQRLVTPQQFSFKPIEDTDEKIQVIKMLFSENEVIADEYEISVYSFILMPSRKIYLVNKNGLKFPLKIFDIDTKEQFFNNFMPYKNYPLNALQIWQYKDLKDGMELLDYIRVFFRWNCLSEGYFRLVETAEDFVIRSMDSSRENEEIAALIKPVEFIEVNKDDDEVIFEVCLAFEDMLLRSKIAVSSKGWIEFKERTILAHNVSILPPFVESYQEAFDIEISKFRVLSQQAISSGVTHAERIVLSSAQIMLEEAGSQLADLDNYAMVGLQIY